MQLTPGERAVLNQLRELYANSSKRDQPISALTRQWPAVHYEAYERVLAALVDRGLAQIVNNGQAIRISDSGLSALGVTVHRLRSKPGRIAAQPPAQSPAQPAQEPARKSRWMFWVR
jgi:hypothetical protein